MREFSTSISDALINGLRRDESLRDTLFLEDLYNLVPTDMALRSYEPVIGVLPIPQEDRKLYYPFPQWFRFENDNIVVTKEDLYKLDEYPTPPFDLRSILLDLGEAPFSESFRAADYGDDWILTSREGTIYKTGGEVKFSNKLKAAAVTKHQNRTVIGGPLNGLWSDRFMEELDNVVNLAELERADFNLELGENFIFWSGFDSSYFPMSLLEPSKLFGAFRQDTAFADLLYSNEFGYMEMPFKGAVLDVISSQEQLFVFSEDGICSLAMNPKATGATFQITGTQPFGIKQRGAVGGDDSTFIFIDNLNQLWGVSRQGLKKLDYSEYMEELSGEIWIVKDPEEPLFYIGDGDTSFVLNNGKLTRVHQTVHNVVAAFNYRAGVVTETGTTEAKVRSNKLDLGNSDLKTLTGVSVGTDRPQSGKVKASATVEDKQISTPDIRLNPSGYGAPRIYGRDHQIEIIFDDYRNMNIDYIELKWQIDDKRQRRGTFTTQDSSGAG